MNFLFEGKRISGILSIIPEHEVRFEDEMHNYNFSPSNSLRLKKVMGYDRHRIVEENICVSDLCIAALSYLFEKALLKKEEIDALILVTQSPDYFIPPTSNVIQGKLGLKQDIICMDINQGCAGFIVGLIQAFLLLDQESIGKVVLLNGDVLSRKVSPRDRNSYPLIGDAASVTILERGRGHEKVYANMQMEGAWYETLIIPAGGFRMPSDQESARLEVDEDNNIRSRDHLHMDGRTVFNFVQTEVPPMIERLLEYGQTNKEKVDYFLFHQPNRFMLQKLADKMGVPYEKMPNNIVENFGNSSGVTIPLNIAFNLGEKLLEHQYTVCLAGFGSGLTWSSMLLQLGNLDFCEIIEYRGK